MQTNDNQTRSGVIDLFVDYVTKPNVEGISGKACSPPCARCLAASAPICGRAVKINL